MTNPMRLIAIVVLALLPAWSGDQPRSQPRDQAARQRTHSRSTPDPAAARADGNSKVTRSKAARAAFQRANPCPATQKTTGACPGYVVDHVIALACGGPDTPANMQWQTVAEGKEKDRWERIGCEVAR
jgi:hypothetical protein